MCASPWLLRCFLEALQHARSYGQFFSKTFWAKYGPDANVISLEEAILNCRNYLPEFFENQKRGATSPAIFAD